eukprot:CAMPEP_0174251820 /NCGR_PEP_ID=MMETSP0439-20130205/1524_1 /TAXON_ID=0 /ORGANISM="Stereomyxa ramosa, Strain Chinc5" /LENGTH=98 /DNA_ID=CAMNT_0015332239 /DNA_START=22 /DNA_END=315 /DNA_ORIENTATION=+
MKVLLVLAALLSLCLAFDKNLCENGLRERIPKNCEQAVEGMNKIMNDPAALYKLQHPVEPFDGCDIGTALDCAGVIADCVDACSEGVDECIDCVGSAW